MKIGKFSKSNALTIDAIRHYMDMNLIIPEKQGGQYDFDDRCQKDLADILSLKEMGFTLNEIKTVFMFKRLANLMPYKENSSFKELFIHKRAELEKQIVELAKMKHNIDNKLNELSNKNEDSKCTIGIDFRMLNIIQCLKCGKSMHLSKADIIDDQIINGKLLCECGEEYNIEKGILNLGKNIVDYDQKFDMNYIADYINDTNTNYLDKFCHGIECIHKKLDFADFKGKTVLELGSGVGFFLRTIFNDIPDDSIYIAVDYDINRHIFLKSILESINHHKNIMLICTDFSSIPIKKNLADIIVDISGTSNYGFEHEEFLLNVIEKYSKDTSQLIGSYILFKNFTATSLIDPEYHKNFLLHNIKANISKLKYDILEETISDYVQEGGKYENYFRRGEKVYSYFIIAKRLG